MQWFTEFPIPKSAFPISHQDQILSMGSCFAQSIGTKLKNHKFQIEINPFGTVFHPLALHDLLEMALFRNSADESYILERDGLFFHYSAHSDLAGTTREELIKKFNQQLTLTRRLLENGNHLILTFGTAWIYELNDGKRVANCHKQLQKLFHKRLSSLEEMKLDMGILFDNLSRVFPNLRITLTVSPVRHIKDGVSENQLSKSLLRVLCSELENRFSFVSYFPSYEIMMDELRDYRFYKPDRIHPTEEAEEYIWNKWSNSCFSPETIQKTNEISKIQRELAHRPINPDSPSHRKFLQNLLQKLERLNGEFDFSKEIQVVKQELESLNS